MAVYFCSDGGGTKLLMLAFDENLRLLAGVRGPAVTTTYITPELARENLFATLRQLISMLPAEVCPEGQRACTRPAPAASGPAMCCISWQMWAELSTSARAPAVCWRARRAAPAF